MKCSSLSLELLYLTTSSVNCQELFSKFFDFRLSLWSPLVWQLFNFNTFKTVCQEVFFVLFQTFRTMFSNCFAAVSNFYMLSHRIEFVKNFFRFFSNSILCFAAPCGQLAYTSTAPSVCQARIYKSRKFFLMRAQGPPLRRSGHEKGRAGALPYTVTLN